MHQFFAYCGIILTSIYHHGIMKSLSEFFSQWQWVVHAHCDMYRSLRSYSAQLCYMYWWCQVSALLSSKKSSQCVNDLSQSSLEHVWLPDGSHYSLRPAAA